MVTEGNGFASVPTERALVGEAHMALRMIQVGTGGMGGDLVSGLPATRTLRRGLIEVVARGGYEPRGCWRTPGSTWD